jgi:hypothetical protein
MVFLGEDTAPKLSTKDLAKNVSLHMKFASPSGKDCLKSKQVHRQKLKNRLNLMWVCLVGTHY